jgi:hypothetical protein
MKQVIIDITPAGTVKVDAVGFKGVGCDKATEQIEISLGGESGKDKKRKPEFYQSPSTTQSNKLTF